MQVSVVILIIGGYQIKYLKPWIVPLQGYLYITGVSGHIGKSYTLDDAIGSPSIKEWEDPMVAGTILNCSGM